MSETDRLDLIAEREVAQANREAALKAREGIIDILEDHVTHALWTARAGLIAGIAMVLLGAALYAYARSLMQ